MVNTVDGNRLCKEGTGVLRGRSAFPDSSAGGKLMSRCLAKPRASPFSWVPGHTVSHPQHDAGPALSPETLPRSQPWGRGASPACASGPAAPRLGTVCREATGADPALTPLQSGRPRALLGVVVWPSGLGEVMSAGGRDHLRSSAVSPSFRASRQTPKPNTSPARP